MMTKYEHHCCRGPSCEGWMGKDEEGRYVLAKDHETKVAELLAEIARVKKESVRIVPDGELCRLQDLESFFCLYGEELLDGKGFSVLTNEYHGYNIRVIPVTLKTWEESDG